MADLFDQSRTNTNEFNPGADNSKINAQSGTLGKVVYAFTLGLFTLGIHYVIKRNNFLRKQNEINNAASLIDVQLTKRHDTLVKLVDAVSGHQKFESDVYTNIAKMRSLINEGASQNSSEIEKLNSSIFGRLFAVAENYPQLKSNELYKELMEQSTYLEREISAARRIYNNHVNEYNQSLFTWPSSVIASSLKLTTKPLYQASSQQRNDVSLGKLSN